MSDPVKESSRILKIRTTIIVGFVLVLQALAQHYNIPLPNFLNDITEMEDSTLLDLGSGLAVISAYIGTLRFPRFEKLFFLGKIFPRKNYEMEAITKLLEQYPLDLMLEEDEPSPTLDPDIGAVRALVRELEQNLESIKRLT